MAQPPPAWQRPPTPTSAMRREPIITLRMDEVAEELRQEKARSRGGTPRAGRASAVRAPESLARCAAGCRFFCACAAGALHSMAPPTLAAAEAACMLAVYLAAVPNAFPTHTRRLHYSFTGSAEDVVLLSLLRCTAVCLAHCLGTGPQFQRPYRLTAALFAALSLPLGLMKLAALRHSQWERRLWAPFIALYCLHMGFAVAQVLAAQRIVEWARRRWEHGLAGLGFPWEEGEEAWLLAGQLSAQQAEEGQAEGPGEGPGEGPPEHDVPAELLADVDSRWARCGALRVHYKLALPRGSAAPGDIGIVLVHSFGGGTFAWRHVMQPLADATGLPVLAFDRPGFGLTDRPPLEPRTPLDSNPYSLKFQALLTLQLASQVGLRQVVLAGHADGALLALMSAAMAAREAALGSPLRPPSPAGSGGTQPVAGSTAEQQQQQQGPGLPPSAPLRPSPFVGWQRTPPVAARPPGATSAQHARRGSGESFSDSLDWAWMSSGPEGAHSLLQKLLRGEWPASIEPRTSASILGFGTAHGNGSSGGNGGNGSGHADAQTTAQPAAQRSPFKQQRRRQQQQQQQNFSLTSGELLEPFLEGEEAEEDVEESQQEADTGQQDGQQAGDVQQQGQSAAADGSSAAGGSWQPGQLGQEGSVISNPSFLSQQQASASSEQQPGLYSLPAQASLIDNPSFLSQTTTAATEAAAAPLHQLPGLPEGESSVMTNPSFVSCQQTAASGSSAGGLAGLPEGSQLIDNPSFLSQTSEPGEPAASRQAGYQQPAVSSGQQDGEGELVAAEEGAGGGAWRAPEPVGLILLHPELSGDVAPKYARVLANSRLGRRVLRSLLRTEVGEVTNRRAWARPEAHLTPELLALYRRPLHVAGWDLALTEVARTRNDIHSFERAQLYSAVVDAGLPVLVATGEQDHLVPPGAISRIAERLGAAAPRLAVLPLCGHVSHEEAPAVLVGFLQQFVLELGLLG